MKLLGPDGRPVQIERAPEVPRTVVVEQDIDHARTYAGDPTPHHMRQEVHHVEDEPPVEDGHARLWASTEAGDGQAAMMWAIAEGIHPPNMPRDGQCLCHLLARNVRRSLAEMGVEVRMPNGTLIQPTLDTSELDELRAAATEVLAQWDGPFDTFEAKEAHDTLRDVLCGE